MTRSTPSRRNILTWALSALGLTTASPALAAELTPRATEGPFYPSASMRRSDVDNDLVKIIGSVRDAGGEVFTLSGRVMDSDGAPLSGHRIEIWQCDLNGKYLHTGDRQSIKFDPAFQGFGHDITGTDGAYVFRTIKPVVYPGRTPHIHVKVFEGTSDSSRELLTSQFYIAGHPANRKDRIFNRLSTREKNAVSMAFEMVDGRTQAVVDVVV